MLHRASGRNVAGATKHKENGTEEEGEEEEEKKKPKKEKSRASELSRKRNDGGSVFLFANCCVDAAALRITGARNNRNIEWTKQSLFFLSIFIRTYNIQRERERAADCSRKGLKWRRANMPSL